MYLMYGEDVIDKFHTWHHFERKTSGAVPLEVMGETAVCRRGPRFTGLGPGAKAGAGAMAGAEAGPEIE